MATFSRWFPFQAGLSWCPKGDSLRNPLAGTENSLQTDKKLSSFGSFSFLSKKGDYRESPYRFPYSIRFIEGPCKKKLKISKKASKRTTRRMHPNKRFWSTRLKTGFTQGFGSTRRSDNGNPNKWQFLFCCPKKRTLRKGALTWYPF